MKPIDKLRMKELDIIKEEVMKEQLQTSGLQGLKSSGFKQKVKRI